MPRSSHAVDWAGVVAPVKAWQLARWAPPLRRPASPIRTEAVDWDPALAIDPNDATLAMVPLTEPIGRLSTAYPSSADQHSRRDAARIHGRPGPLRWRKPLTAAITSPCTARWARTAKASCTCAERRAGRRERPRLPGDPDRDAGHHAPGRRDGQTTAVAAIIVTHESLTRHGSYEKIFISSGPTTRRICLHHRSNAEESR